MSRGAKARKWIARESGRGLSDTRPKGKRERTERGRRKQEGNSLRLFPRKSSHTCAAGAARAPVSGLAMASVAMTREGEEGR